MKKIFFIFGIVCCFLFADTNLDNEINDLIIQKSIDSTNDDISFTIDSNMQIKDILDVYKNDTDVFNLKYLLEKAQNNYTMQAKNIAIEETQATRSSIFGQYLPSIDLGYNYNLSKRASSQSITNNQLQASLNWVLFNGGAREFSLLSNNALIKAAIADKGYSQEVLFLQVISSYYEYFSLKGQIIAIVQKKKNIEANVARIQVLYDAGLTTIDALEALKAEVSATDYQLQTLQLQFQQIKLQLSLFTNMDVDKLKRVNIKDPEFREIQSLNITMQEEQAQSVDYQVGTITYWPTIAVFDTFNWNFNNINENNSIASFSYPRHQNVFGISLTWNIFNGFTTNRQKEALKLTNLRLQKNIAYAKEEQKNKIKLYKQSIDIAISQIKSAAAALKSATISFESVLQKYNAQLMNYNNYLDALTTRYNAEAIYIQSLNNYELQKANYIFYSGQMLLEYVE